MIGLSMAAERESHACVSQPHSAEHPNHADLFRPRVGVGSGWGRAAT